MPDETKANAQQCYHCALPLPPGAHWFTTIDSVRQPMCCAGCQAVAQAIVDAGLDDYYRHRNAPASGPDVVVPQLADLALYDTPEAQQGFVRRDGELAEATLMVEGLRCGACQWLVERALAAQPGVEQAAVNFATERAVVRWDPSRARLSQLLARVGAVGYRARPFDTRAREAQIARTSRALSRRLFVAGIGMMQVMMYALPAYWAAPGEIEWQHAVLMRWASLVLTIPVLLYSAQPFFTGALRDLRARSLGMDVPVALGIGAAFAASAWATITGAGEVYFDSVTMFVFLLLGARQLEWVARRRASRAVDALSAATPEHVTRLLALEAPVTPARLAAAATESVPAARVAVGDVLRVDAGERIAVDALVLTGSTAIDQSLLTGESAPVPRAPGDEVAGGSINAGSPVHVRALRTLGESAPSMIERLIERAALERPAAAMLADRVAAWFVLALLAVAVAVLAAWWWIDPARALPIAITVLVVSCPCALSLATPAAIAAATGAVTRAGVLVTSGRALETLARCTDVVFDKTGTLTEGRPGVVAVDLFGGCSRERALALAAALETGAAHPLANALRGAHDGPHGARGSDGARDGSEPESESETQVVATDIRHAPGQGVQASVDGVELRLGSGTFARQWADLPETPGPVGSQVWLVARGTVLARFVLRDTLRADARATIAAMRALGLRVHLLSGDDPAVVAALAADLGIDRVRGGATPAGKLEHLKALQREGAVVMMVGDGVNDAPVLAAADVSIAVGEASALARTAADTVLLSPRLDRIVGLVDAARRTRRVIAQNLAWAGVYNAIAIPAAAIGWVAPWAAAIGMSGSSLLVAANALRLLRPVAETGAGVAAAAAGQTGQSGHPGRAAQPTVQATSVPSARKSP